MSEILVAPVDNSNPHGLAGGWDVRGDILNDDPNFAATQFMTIHPPNSPTPDVTCCQPTDDPLMPCVHWWSPGNATNVQQAARSRHLGGVNAAFADGSVRFARNDVSAEIWRALGTMNGGEVASLPD
jgi:prepilin-type processing-associated H-X9-DG protein